MPTFFAFLPATLVSAALLAASATAAAQTAPVPVPAPAASAAAADAPALVPIPGGPEAAGVRGPAPEGLYQALGEKEGIAALMGDMVDRALKDPRIGPIFENSFRQMRPQALKDSLAAQICVLAGGPCEYEGTDMKYAHAQLKIDKAQFNALVEVLQDAMDARGIPFTQQNRLLALLAPMHRDIITVH